MQMNVSETEKKKRIQRYGGLLMLAVTCFFVLVCTPVYVFSYADIMIRDTIFPVLWDFVQDAVLYLYYWIAFSFLIYLFARYSAKSTGFLVLVYVGCSFLKYFLSLLISNLIIPDWGSMDYHLYYVSIDVFGDLVLLGIAFLICYLLLHRKRKEKNIKFDFSKIFQASNLILRCAMLISVVLMVSRLGSRAIFDINAGAPLGTVDLFGMILYYLGDIGSGVIGYLLMFLILSKIDLRDESSK